MTDAGDIARMKRIVERVRARGVRVVYVDGWSQRGATFPVVPNASFVHHDASSSRSGTWGALGIITYGRSGIPGPLSQFQVARGNTAQLAVVGAGIANHAGRGGPLKGLPQNNANRETYGMEVANNGVGEKYSDATIKAIRVLQASIAEESKFSVDMVIGHKEWTNRKIDPTYSMNWMRGLVKDTMTKSPGGEEDMPLSKDDVVKIWKTDGIIKNKNAAPGTKDPYWTAATFFEHIEDIQDEEHRLLKEVRAEVAAIRSGLVSHDARLTDVAALLQQHSDGTLDAEDVVRRIGELLAEKEDDQS